MKWRDIVADVMLIYLLNVGS